MTKIQSLIFQLRYNLICQHDELRYGYSICKYEGSRYLVFKDDICNLGQPVMEKPQV
jgi:hypothetical protein